MAANTHITHFHECLIQSLKARSFGHCRLAVVPELRLHVT